MPSLKVQVTRIVDHSYPIWVECIFTDAKGKEHTIHEKVPVISAENISEIELPMSKQIDCLVEDQWRDKKGISISRIKFPWSIESIEGMTSFEILSENLEK
ncbi:MAG: hypothetical protein HKN36_12990 [Hellea sp.]|nr:hypothetical protein [Hellea sp.]